MWGWIFVGSAIALIEMTPIIWVWRAFGFFFGIYAVLLVGIFGSAALMAPIWIGRALAHHIQLPLFTMLGIHV